jgi:hypothetical protein
MGGDHRRQEVGVKRPEPAFSRADFLGDALLTLIAGFLLLSTVFLPWANTRVSGTVNLALTHPATIKGILGTPWGAPVLAASIVVLAVGGLMLLRGASRLAPLYGAVVFAAGVVTIVDAVRAYDQIRLSMSTGLGLFLALVIGLVLLPIGFADATVGWVVATRGASDDIAERDDADVLE